MDCIRSVLADCCPPSALEDQTPHIRLSPNSSLPSVGPITLRRCTDCFCLLTYALLLLACVSYCAVKFPSTMWSSHRPFDSDHQPCFPPFQFIYIPTLDLHRTVCVSQCPPQPGIPLQCLRNTIFRECPSSAAGMIRDVSLQACYRQDLLISKPPLTVRILNSIARSPFSYLAPCIFTMLVCAFIVATTYLMPGIMTYIHMLLFEATLILAAVFCFYRYFARHSPILDKYAPLIGNSSTILLVLGILFVLIVIVSISLICYWFRRSQMIFLVIVIRIARFCYCGGILVLVSFLLSVLCVAVGMGFVWMLQIVRGVGVLNGSNDPWSQFEQSPLARLFQVLIVLMAIWTHGFMCSLSHFVFQSMATLWYHSPIKSIGVYNSLFQTVKVVVNHLGTIVYGSVYQYYSQTLTTLFNHNPLTLTPVMYQYLCCLHNCCCRYLFKYSFIETILNSVPFWEANIRFYQLRKRTAMSIPQIYMYGNFWSNTVRAMVVLMSVFMTLLYLRWKETVYYGDWLNMAGPIMISGAMSYQVATTWVDSVGMLGDTIVFNYCIQNYFRLQTYGLLDAPHCPMGVLDLITNAKPILI